MAEITKLYFKNENQRMEAMGDFYVTKDYKDIKEVPEHRKPQNT